mmetsp:Transcript_32679/g.71304  ORF Transcript_32679/g.71304 Transcript_32679/m.71304 type:complete len:264 (+) Transcript_32679:100-891(+)
MPKKNHWPQQVASVALVPVASAHACSFDTSLRVGPQSRTSPTGLRLSSARETCDTRPRSASSLINRTRGLRRPRTIARDVVIGRVRLAVRIRKHVRALRVHTIVLRGTIMLLSLAVVRPNDIPHSRAATRRRIRARRPLPDVHYVAVVASPAFHVVGPAYHRFLCLPACGGPGRIRSSLTRAFTTREPPSKRRATVGSSARVLGSRLPRFWSIQNQSKALISPLPCRIRSEVHAGNRSGRPTPVASTLCVHDLELAFGVVCLL